MVIEGEGSGVKREEEENPPIQSPGPHSSLRKRVISLPSFSVKIPNLKTCHRCGLKTDSLQLLGSHWRIVLLCANCLAALRSGEICSYCFVEISEDADMFLNCLRCLCRIHYTCIPYHRYYVSPSQIDAESFTCVDCYPVPRPWSRTDADCSSDVDAVVEVLEPLDLFDPNEQMDL